MKKRKGIFIIAEIGVNHNGSLKMALQLIDAAAAAGADAVKFQTFRAEQVMVPYALKAAYQKQYTQSNESQLDMVKRLELDEQMHLTLKEHSLKKGVQFLSTPFDSASLEFLAAALQMPVIKIASGEITNAPLLLQAARLGTAIIMSTGMSTLGDIEAALGVLAFGYGGGNDCAPSLNAFKAAYCSSKGQRLLRDKVTLLHCTTEYPAPVSEVNLRVLATLRQCFGLPVGYSDHTLGTAVPLAAAALGAVVIEKHLTLERGLPGPDHQASLEPGEFSEMVKGIRQIEQALGEPYKKPAASESDNLAVVRKSIVAARTIKQGELFTEENLTVKRPGGGLSPLQFWDLLGRAAARAYLPNEVIR